MFNYKIAIYAKKRAEKKLIHPYTPLPDVIHEMTPTINMYIPDICICIIFCYILYFHFNMMYIPKYVIQLNVLGYSLSIRPLFIYVTTMPTCIARTRQITTSYHQHFLSTHDLMFSGHTILFCFFGKFIFLFEIRRIFENRLVKFFN